MIKKMMMNEKKRKKEKWGSRVKTQKGQSRAKEVFETLSKVSKIEMQHPEYFRSLWKPSNPLKAGANFWRHIDWKEWESKNQDMFITLKSPLFSFGT